MRLAIETKHPTRHTRKVEEALVACLERFGLLKEGTPAEWAGKPAVRMMSFSQLAVRRMSDLAPGMPTVQLIGKRLRPLRRELLLGSAPAVGPSIAIIRADPDFVAAAHAAGKQVHVWTVNRAADMQLAHDLGVDVIITDPPATCCAGSGPPSRSRRRRPGSVPRGVVLCSRQRSRAQLCGNLMCQARSVSSSAAMRSPGVS